MKMMICLYLKSKSRRLIFVSFVWENGGEESSINRCRKEWVSRRYVYTNERHGSYLSIT